MSATLIAVIRKEAKVGPEKPSQTNYYATLQFFNEEGSAYSMPLYCSGYLEVEKLIEREAVVPCGEFRARHTAYQRGDEVRIRLTVENEETVRNLGFKPKTAA